MPEIKFEDYVGLKLSDITKEEKGPLKIIFSNGYFIEVSGNILLKKGLAIESSDSKGSKAKSQKSSKKFRGSR